MTKYSELSGVLRKVENYGGRDWYLIVSFLIILYVLVIMFYFYWKNLRIVVCRKEVKGRNNKSLEWSHRIIDPIGKCNLYFLFLLLLFLTSSCLRLLRKYVSSLIYSSDQFNISDSTFFIFLRLINYVYNFVRSSLKG